MGQIWTLFSEILIVGQIWTPILLHGPIGNLLFTYLQSKKYTYPFKMSKYEEKNNVQYCPAIFLEKLWILLKIEKNIFMKYKNHINMFCLSTRLYPIPFY